MNLRPRIIAFMNIGIVPGVVVVFFSESVEVGYITKSQFILHVNIP
jgi:hypothetical protein